MRSRRRLIARPACTAVLVLVALGAPAAEESPLDAATALLRQCARAELDIQADAAALDPAIALFREALENPDTEAGAAVGLLKAIYLKGTYGPLTRDEKKAVLNEACHEGEALFKKHPDSGPLAYFLAVCWGRWAEEYGKLAAARQGTADRIRELLEAAIRLGPEGTTTDAYRLLGRVHHQSPRIPFFLGWPSDAEAIRLLEKAEARAPNIPATQFFLGDVLAGERRKEEAVAVLKKGVALSPRPDDKLEDERYIRDCAQLLKKLTR